MREFQLLPCLRNFISFHIVCCFPNEHPALTNPHEGFALPTLSRFERCGKSEDLESIDLHTPPQSPLFTQAYV